MRFSIFIIALLSVTTTTIAQTGWLGNNGLLFPNTTTTKVGIGTPTPIRFLDVIGRDPKEAVISGNNTDASTTAIGIAGYTVSGTAVNANGGTGIAVDANAPFGTALRTSGKILLQNLVQQNTFSRILASDASGNVAWRDAATLGGSGGVAGWGLLGNAAPAGSFVGTTNSTPLMFKSQNGQVGLFNATNTFIGQSAGIFTTGGDNSAFGYFSLRSNTTGVQNTAIGVYSLELNKSSANTAIGSYSLQFNTNGIANTANGASALGLNTTGSRNTAIGSNSLQFCTIGEENTGMGYASLGQNTIGSYNTGVGATSLWSLTTGINNTAVGYNADVTIGNVTNTVVLGAGARVNASNKVRIGNTATTVIEGQVAFTPSDARFKSNVSNKIAGLDLVMRLKPVTYNFEYSKFSQFLGEKGVDEATLKQKETQREIGFLAQDIEKTLKELGLNVSNLVHKPESDKDNYSVAYGQLVVPLVKAVQEQQAQIEGLKEEIKSIKQLLAQNDKSLTTPSVSDEANIEQSVPNPTNGNATIAYTLPKSVKNARLMISDLTGKQLQNIALTETKGHITVDMQQAGVFLYTLIVDGKIINSKKMVVEK